MKALKPWRWLFRKRNAVFDGGLQGKPGLNKMKQLPFMGIVCIVMLVIVYRTTNYQYQQTEMETKFQPFGNLEDLPSTGSLVNLPQGIIQAHSDLELRPLWSTHSSRSQSPMRMITVLNFQANVTSNHNLLAIPVGIKQKYNVDMIVKKFLPENFTIILFHYDGNVDGWWDLEWSSKAIHIVAQNQTKWWFAKRFLHPNVVSIYDYIFLWDEDLGVENFNPRRYLEIMRSEGLEISQPALDPNSTDIHHRITIRKRTKRVHRRVWDLRGSVKCTNNSEGPPCTGFVEGMAPVFSRSAWQCTWHLIQNDLVHGWGMDMKLGYCAQGDRSKKVGVIDREFVVHQGIQTLGDGSPSVKKASKDTSEETAKRHGAPAVDKRSEIRRQSTWELGVFRDRWDKAVKEDRKWVDPYKRTPVPYKRIQRHRNQNRKSLLPV